MQTAEREILDAVVGRVWGPDVSELGNLAYYVEDDPRKRSVKTVHRAMEPRTRKATKFRIPRPWLKKFDLSAPICPTGVSTASMIHDSKLHAHKSFATLWRFKNEDILCRDHAA